MSKEQCPAGVDCPDYIQEACDDVYLLYGEYPFQEQMAKYMRAEIENVAQQIQQHQLRERSEG